jgi:hypothetical protein
VIRLASIVNDREQPKTANEFRSDCAVAVERLRAKQVIRAGHAAWTALRAQTILLLPDTLRSRVTDER